MKIKNVIMAAALLLVANGVYAQDFSNLDNIQLKAGADYRNNDSVALNCANYLLNTPVDTFDVSHRNTFTFLMRWITGTPDYTFRVDADIAVKAAPTPALMAVYMASIAKFALENKEQSKDADAVKYNSFLIFIQYCENPNNHVQQTKEIKNLIKAKNDNTLKAYLKINSTAN